jgi:hypothetical protein
MKWKALPFLIALSVFVPALAGFIQPAAAAQEWFDAVPASALQQNVKPQGAKTCEQFSTGAGSFYVCDDFLAEFHSVGLELGDPGVSTRESIMLFGYPLTSAFSYHGQWIQVFERAVFEYHPENKQPYVVEFRLLGSEELNSLPKDFINASPVKCDQKFTETGKCLSGRFLQFWQQNGGLSVFGFPITSDTSLKGIWSQDLERWMFELHPENPKPFDVLGRRMGADWLQARMPGSGAGVQNCTATKLGSHDPGTPWDLDASNGVIILNVWGNATNPNYSLHKSLMAEGQVWHLVHAGGDAVQYPKGCSAQAQKDFDQNPNPAATWKDLNAAKLAQ